MNATQISARSSIFSLQYHFVVSVLRNKFRYPISVSGSPDQCYPGLVYQDLLELLSGRGEKRVKTAHNEGSC
jgi:hypothetical protein